MTVLLVCIGSLTGLLTGLTGASGMSVLISALLLVGLDIRDVIGLTFAVTLTNATTAMIPYIRQGQWDRRLALAIGLPATGAVFIGNAIGRGVPSTGLTALMAVALLGIGIRFLFFQRASPLTSEAVDACPRAPTAALVLMGVVIGVAMGMMGGGGSIFISASLILLFHIPLRIALGTSIVIMGMAAVPGVALNVAQTHLNLTHAALLVVPGAVAAVIGASIANRVSERTVQLVLGSYLVIVSSVLLLRMVRA